MNRRDLIRRGPLALLGIVGVAIGIKAAGSQPSDVWIKAHRHKLVEDTMPPTKPMSRAQIQRMIDAYYS